MASPKAKRQERELSSLLEQADAALARRQRQREREAPDDAVVVPTLGEEEAFADIEANRFYAIMFQEGVAPRPARRSRRSAPRWASSSR